MVHVIIRHKVSDYGKWKESFDAYLNTRLAAGETGFRVFQSAEDPRDVVVLLDWDSFDNARRFMGSAELRSRMQNAGVLGEAEIQYVQDARAVRRTAAD